jgi:hypothetical protein
VLLSFAWEDLAEVSDIIISRQWEDCSVVTGVQLKSLVANKANSECKCNLLHSGVGVNLYAKTKQFLSYLEHPGEQLI